MTTFRPILRLALLLLVTLLVGCSPKPPSQPEIDPFESFNRKVFAFNQTLDRYAYRPVAVVYRTFTPPPARQGITNFFNNIDTLTTFGNDLLQGKFKYLVIDFWRFFLNTTVGIGGLFNVADALHVPPHQNDFGTTLSYWTGNSDSAFIMLPFFGPSTLRDMYAMPVNFLMSPYPYIRPRQPVFFVQGLYYVSLRAQLLDSDALLAHAFDPYVLMRNAYLQNRRSQIQTNRGDQSSLPDETGQATAADDST